MNGAKKNYLIVNFHGVSEVKGKRFNNRHYDAFEFEKFLIYLKDNFEIVSIQEIFRMHDENIIPKKKTIALTFDDGYVNNFTTALPILKKHNIPATYFIISKGLVDDDFIVWPDIIDLVQRSAKEDIVLDGNVFKYPGFHCEKLNKSLVDHLKEVGAKRDEYVSALAQKYPLYKEVRKNDPDLIELIRKNNFGKYANEPLIEYGSHTHAHYNLEYLSKEDAKYEMQESAKLISDHIKKEVLSIAFPDGSYSKETLDLAFAAGYKYLLAVDYKFNEANKVKGLLARFTVSNSTTPESNILRLAKQFDQYGF